MSVLMALMVLWSPSIWADTVRVAVASNFSAPMQRIAQQFEQASGHRVQLALGATGAFYAQIKNGAPFDVLLAADSLTPQRLEQEGLGVIGSRFTYATGKLVLWSPRKGYVDDQGQILNAPNLHRLVMADPKLAPYGVAAQQVLEALQVSDRLRAKLVMGASIAQALQFVSSGNADLGFVSLSQVQGPLAASGSLWVIPEHLYQPIRQDAVLLHRGRGNEAARALLVHLQGEAARAVIRAFGYGI